MAGVNVFAELFGILRQRGLVERIRHKRTLIGFVLAATVVSIVGAGCYGFAMGIGLGIETALKDAVKAGLIAALCLVLGVPIFVLAFRLLGREESPGQVAAVPVTFVVTVVIILTVSTPVVFLLSVLAGLSPDAIYIHIVIVDVALLVGLYVSGTLVYHALPVDRGRLAVPNIVGFVLTAVVLVVLVGFFRPFLAPWPSFSVGTDRLKDGLGIGVAAKVERALAAAAAANRVRYHFQTTNANGDPERDYTVTRAGDSFLLQIQLHAEPGKQMRADGNIWLMNGTAYADFDGGRVSKMAEAEVAPYLTLALPPEAFGFPEGFASARWRAWQGSGSYAASGIAPDGGHFQVLLDAQTGRLRELVVETGISGPRAQTRVSGLDHASVDAAGLEADLNRAIVLGKVDGTDAALDTYVQNELAFALRYPRSWQVGAWQVDQRSVAFHSDCSEAQACPAVQVSVYELEQGKDAAQYADDLAWALRLDPTYREVHAETRIVEGVNAGVVTYLSDRIEKGELKTKAHAEYIFVGRHQRYHMGFSAPDDAFEAYKELFAVMAGLFVFLT